MNATEMELLRTRIRRDIVVDTVGNFLLFIGLYAWFGRASWLPAWCRTEPFIVLSVSTGILSLFHLPARLTRFRQWRAAQEDDK